jgi:hypothetical protein
VPDLLVPVVVGPASKLRNSGCLTSNINRVCFIMQLCDGASPEERQRWFLRPAQEFSYLNQSTCYDIPGDSNAEEYKVMLRHCSCSQPAVLCIVVCCSSETCYCRSVLRQLAGCKSSDTASSAPVAYIASAGGCALQ